MAPFCNVFAEGEGFKPPIPEKGIPDFESSAIDHSANSPKNRMQRYYVFLKYPKDILVFLKKMSTFARELENVHI